MRRLPAALLLIGFALLAGCSGSDLDRRYLDTALDEPLEMPPDLSKAENPSSFDLPQVFAGDGTTAAGTVPVLASLESVRLGGSPGVYWLDADIPATDLYQHVKNFWASEGYRLVIDEPIIGIMQTEWIYREIGRESPADSWWESLFATDDLSAVQDQYRTRIERAASGGGSRVYLVHRGTEYVDEIEIGDNNTDDGEDREWSVRRSDPELEIEMLSRLMVYLGLQQAAIDEQVSDVSLFKPRARLERDLEEESPFLILFDSYHIAWNRVYNVLQRMNYDIELAEFDSGLLNEGVFRVNVDVVKDVDRGFFSFGASDEREQIQFNLVLTEESHIQTRMILEDEGGNFDTSVAGGEFVEMLFEELK